MNRKTEILTRDIVLDRDVILSKIPKDKVSIVIPSEFINKENGSINMLGFLTYMEETESICVEYDI